MNNNQWIPNELEEWLRKSGIAFTASMSTEQLEAALSQANDHGVEPYFAELLERCCAMKELQELEEERERARAENKKLDEDEWDIESFDNDIELVKRRIRDAEEAVLQEARLRHDPLYQSLRKFLESS